MNGFSWQDVVVGAIAVLALAWLVARRLRRSRRPGAPACENCPSAAPAPRGVRPAPQPEILLGIGEPSRRDGSRR